MRRLMLLAVPVVLVLLVVGSGTGCSDDDSGGGDADDDPCAFDTGDWVELDPIDGDEGDDRRYLATRLIDCDLLAGKSRDAVADLLGGTGGDAAAPTWEYLIGAEELGVDFELLVVTFGDDGRVESVGRGQS